MLAVGRQAALAKCRPQRRRAEYVRPELRQVVPPHSWVPECTIPASINASRTSGASYRTLDNALE